MKNYPHLYPNPLSKKISLKTKSPLKTMTPSTLTYTTKTSIKSFMPYQQKNKQKKLSKHTLTRSIQQINYRKIQNQEYGSINVVSNCSQDQQLFSQSCSKIGKIKQSFPIENIDKQLNDVLLMIRDEKNKIFQKLKILKKSNDQYKKILNNNNNKIQCGVNTDDMILISNQNQVIDQQVQCKIQQPIKIIDLEEISFQEKKQDEDSQDQNVQAYLKLSKMLEEMKINPDQVLPQYKKIPKQITKFNFKNLGDTDIIKIQKFFIKKMIQKLPK